MITERGTNLVITDKLYLTSMVEMDVFGDEQELIHVDGKISMDETNLYLRGRKEFLETLIKKKKVVLNLINDLS